MITVVRPIPDATDSYGAPVISATEEFGCPGAFVAPRMSEDLHDTGRAGVVVGLTLFVPFGFDVLHGDRVSVDGVLYEVEGDPADWRNPFTGWEAGTTIPLRRVDG